MKRVPPTVLVVASIISVQLGSSFAKDLMHAAPPPAVAWLRITAAAIGLMIIARPRLRGRPGSDWPGVVAYGLVTACMNLVFYFAIQRIPIGMAVTFEFLGPLGVAVASSRRPRDFVWAGLAAVGVALLGFTPGTLDPVGVVCALGAGAFWAAYIVLAGKVGQHWSGVSGVAVAALIGSVTLVIPAATTTGAGWASEPRVWALGAAVGVLSTLIPYGLEMVALRRIDRGVFGILMSIEPAMAALFAFALLGEQLRPIEFVAMACVIAASVGSAVTARTAPGPEPKLDA